MSDRRVDKRIVIHHRSPMFADVLSGAVPRPDEWRGDMLPDQVDAWARSAPAVADLIGPDDLIVYSTDLDEILTWAIGDECVLLAAIGPDGRVQLIAANIDGTRAATTKATGER